MERFWEKATALGPGSIGKALFTDRVIALIRREIRRDTGLLIDPEDLANSLNEMLSAEAREQIGPVRVRKRRRRSRDTQTGQPSVEASADSAGKDPTTA